jgi:putative RNA 2'-phosphotransferase
MSTQSKFLSLILRHKPETIGLFIDGHGWADVKELLGKIQQEQFPEFNMVELERLVKNNSKKRFEFNDDQTKIRACQGHSINVDLGLSSTKPSLFLYHGTIEVTWDAFIRHEGLKPMERDLVHLSATRDAAMEVARRRKGIPIILEILSLAMWENNYQFFKASNGVWLTRFVPREFIYLPLRKKYEEN